MPLSFYCPKCGTNIQTKGSFCPKCGYKYLWTCGYCGTQNPPINNFCTSCGKDISQKKIREKGLSIQRAELWSKQFAKMEMINKNTLSIYEEFEAILKKYVTSDVLVFSCHCGSMNHIAHCSLSGVPQIFVLGTSQFIAMTNKNSKGQYFFYNEIQQYEIYNDTILLNLTNGDQLTIKYDLPKANFWDIAGFLFSQDLAVEYLSYGNLTESKNEKIEFMKIISMFWSEAIDGYKAI